MWNLTGLFNLLVVARFRPGRCTTCKLCSYCDGRPGRSWGWTFTTAAGAFVVLYSARSCFPTTWTIKLSIAARSFQSSLERNTCTSSSSGRPVGAVQGRWFIGYFIRRSDTHVLNYIWGDKYPKLYFVCTTHFSSCHHLGLNDAWRNNHLSEAIL